MTVPFEFLWSLNEPRTSILCIINEFSTFCFCRFDFTVWENFIAFLGLFDLGWSLSKSITLQCNAITVTLQFVWRPFIMSFFFFLEPNCMFCCYFLICQVEFGWARVGWGRVGGKAQTLKISRLTLGAVAPNFLNGRSIFLPVLWYVVIGNYMMWKRKNVALEVT